MKKKIKRTISLLLAFSLACGYSQLTDTRVKAQEQIQKILINEACSKNTAGIKAENGERYDWIEIYNPGNEDYDLSGYGLSDDPAVPYKFRFGEVTIKAKEFLLVYADKKASFTSSELLVPFGLSSDGETLILTDSEGNTSDIFELPAITADTTYGRKPDGSSEFAVLTPTPGQTNNTDSEVKEIPAPVFSTESGFYNEAFSLGITTSENTVIRYTLDGSQPAQDSPVYTGELSIKDVSGSKNIYSAISTTVFPGYFYTPSTSRVPKGTIVRAAAFDADGNSSETVTKSYFIGYQNRSDYYGKVPVISLVTDPADLFDYDNGIYVTGAKYDEWLASGGNPETTPDAEKPANYQEKWEKISSLTYFNPDGTQAFTQNVGIRIHGGASRCVMQKSFNIYARKEYGSGSFKFDLFNNLKAETDGSDIDKFSSLMLRNGGNDCAFTKIRDPYIQELVSDRDFGTQASQPCAVFLDGEYWGVYNLREKFSEDYIKSHYGIKKDDVIIIKNNELDEGLAEDIQYYKDLIDFAVKNDLSDDSKYSQISDMMDIQSFIDYFSSEIYIANHDWVSNNFSLFRARNIDPENPYADEKWRWLMFDTEYSSGMYQKSYTAYNRDSFRFVMNDRGSNSIAKLFTSLLKNEQFKKQFVTTFMDIANNNFDSEKTNALLSSYSSQYRSLMTDYFLRYSSKTADSAGKYFDTQVSYIGSFFNNRYDYITKQMKTALNLSGNLTDVTIKNTGTGMTMINTVKTSEDEWTGSYYTDYPVTVSAVPDEGCTFKEWKVTSAGKTQVYNDSTINVDLTQDPVIIEAVYESSQGSDPDIIKGDVDGNGSVTASDITMLTGYLLSAQKLTEEQISAADINKDSRVNVLDLIGLKRLLLSI
ncbi:MAG: CotH kinase family protein [Oscillospiraceae bacterium]|nr:CotH kinase family protein [Oscillospiraceae bacterium]